MKTEWQTELCSNYPVVFEKLNQDTYIQRRNIRKREVISDDMMGDPGYICESRFISEDIFETFMEQLESPSQQQIVNHFVTVQDNQSISDENMLIIMSAITDLYETIIS